MRGVLIRRRKETQTDTQGDGRVKMEAETEVMHLLIQAKERQGFMAAAAARREAWN